MCVAPLKKSIDLSFKAFRSLIFDSFVVVCCFGSRCDIGGSKRACTANSDTVCNENGGGNLSGGGKVSLSIIAF